jgi:hypothetical protein
VKSRAPEVKVLDDADLLKMHANTKRDFWFDVWRFNIIVLAYNLGQRRESLQELTVGNFHPWAGIGYKAFKTETVALLIKTVIFFRAWF